MAQDRAQRTNEELHSHHLSANCLLSPTVVLTEERRPENLQSKVILSVFRARLEQFVFLSRIVDLPFSSSGRS
eukprot:scaffold13247_cov64-Cylindrotheca_fusiformis.AAC.1